MKRFILFLTLLIINCQLLIATIRYVSHSGTSTPPYITWYTAADSIQKCINYSVAGDTIYVANGVYEEKVDIENKFLSLIGSSQDSCIVDARSFETPSNFDAVRVVGGSNISGFYVKVSTQHYGSGFKLRYCDSTSQIKNNKVENCSNGAYIFNSHLTFKHNLITDANTGVHLEAYTENYYPVIDSNVIVTAVITYPGKGIEAGFGTSPTIRNNLIINENAGDGIKPIYYPLKIQNNLILQSGTNSNSLFYYGILTSLGSGEIFNNMVKSTYANEGYHIFQGNNEINNNDLVGSSIGYIFNNVDTIKFRYNNVWDTDIPYSGFTADSTNITSDPMFVNEDSSNFHLQMYSPLIDKGDPDILDKDGSRSDIGVFGGPLGESYTYQDLAPKPPSNLTAVYDSGFVKLTWNKNTEADLYRYRVYRDTVAEFIYDTTKIIAVTADSFYYDDLPEKYIAGNYYYKITAIDTAYHQSAASEEVHIAVTGAPEGPPLVVRDYKLLYNYPNPFNPDTKIPYRLKDAGYVKLMVYDIKGELLSVLVNEYQNAGYYEVEFKPNITEKERGKLQHPFATGYRGDIASGIYLYRIEVIGKGNIPVYSDMKKMILLK